MRIHSEPGLCTIGLALLVSAVFLPVARSQGLAADDFVSAAEQGFGDRQNSWAWSMKWWRGKLYVGTNRAYSCVSQWELHRFISPILFPYPPPSSDLDCAPNPADLRLQAEIWRWTPETNIWEMVYRSPNDLDNPEYPGKKVPRDNGFRTMEVHTGPDGIEALYVGGITTEPMWEGGPLPPPRILRSTDGETFAPIPQDSGTFMGNLSHESIRTLTSFAGQLFAVHGSVQGGGVILASSNPAAGNDEWRQVSPEGLLVFEMEAFNGWLYVGKIDLVRGYSVLKARAAGPTPYQFTPVVEAGAYLPNRPAASVLSMYQFQQRLYVGGGAFFFPNQPTELIRIDARDRWELVVGEPRQTPSGWKYPLTGLGDGFENGFNDHMWRMQDHDGRLYVGTYDGSGEWNLLPGVPPMVGDVLGADLFHTADGWYFTSVTTDGFSDKLSFGIRTFASTPFGLFIGTTNPFYGLQVFRGVEQLRLAAPERVEVELVQQQPVISWNAVSGAAIYRVFRAPVNTMSLYPGLFGHPSLPEPFEETAVTSETVFVDEPLGAGQRYLYHVIAEGPSGNRSQSSNLVRVPLLTPPMTFTGLIGIVQSMAIGQLFSSSQAYSATLTAILQARGLVALGDVANGISVLRLLRQAVLQGGVAQTPYHTDLEIQINKLERRLSLLIGGQISRSSVE